MKQARINFNAERNRGCVFYNRSKDNWRIYQTINGKRVFRGSKPTKPEAVAALNEYQKEVYGEHARLRHV